MKPIVDSHLDLAWNALFWDRDLTRSLAEINERERGMTDDKARGNATTCLPELRRGKIAVSLATVLVRERPKSRPKKGHLRNSLDFSSPEAVYAVSQAHLAYYRLLEGRGELRVLPSAAALEHYWREVVEPAEAELPPEAPLGIILSMEGADPIVTPAQAGAWWEQGLRVASLVHYGSNRYAAGTGDEGPLTGLGRELLAEFERLGVILDLTHLADESFYEAVEGFGGALLASHQNCRELVPGQRQFSDDQVRRILERGGVLGCALDAWMLYPGWKRGETRREVVQLEAVADHIDRICELAGNARYVAIGSDLDGGFGTEQTPVGLETIADLQKLDGILQGRGYTEEDIAGVFHGNWRRFFGEHLPRE